MKLYIKEAINLIYNLDIIYPIKLYNTKTKKYEDCHAGMGELLSNIDIHKILSYEEFNDQKFYIIPYNPVYKIEIYPNMKLDKINYILFNFDDEKLFNLYDVYYNNIMPNTFGVYNIENIKDKIIDISQHINKMTILYIQEI